ncbi:hypothetical protein [Paenibacillus polymyxa]|uniref:hypothetical protein n=1 Tax=Paenibacillus polymyxa TaxID=1406 RepID=UPI0032167D43
MTVKRISTRKVRSDKKKSIAPFVPDVFRIWIHRIARHLEIPEGEIGVFLIDAAVHNDDCIRFFSAYYKRNLSHENSLFLGNDFAAPIDEYIRITGNRDRFKVRVSKTLYNRIGEFQIALGTPYLAHATHALLRYALHTKSIVLQIAPTINYESLFENAPFPRPHTQLTISDLAFPKDSSIRNKKSKPEENTLSKEVSKQKTENEKNVGRKLEERSVWSILR